MDIFPLSSYHFSYKNEEKQEKSPTNPQMQDSEWQNNHASSILFLVKT